MNFRKSFYSIILITFGFIVIAAVASVFMQLLAAEIAIVAAMTTWLLFLLWLVYVAIREKMR